MLGGVEVTLAVGRQQFVVEGADPRDGGALAAQVAGHQPGRQPVESALDLIEGIPDGAQQLHREPQPLLRGLLGVRVAGCDPGTHRRDVDLVGRHDGNRGLHQGGCGQVRVTGGGVLHSGGRRCLAGQVPESVGDVEEGVVQPLAQRVRLQEERVDLRAPLRGEFLVLLALVAQFVLVLGPRVRRDRADLDLQAVEGMEVVVEGIENQAQMDVLRVIGCTLFQGYHLARPTGEQDYLNRYAGQAIAAERRNA